MRRSRWSKPLAFALGLSLVAAACGDDDDDDDRHRGHHRDDRGDRGDDCRRRSGVRLHRLPGHRRRRRRRPLVQPDGVRRPGGGRRGDRLRARSCSSRRPTADFEPNVHALLDAGLRPDHHRRLPLGDATAAAAEANPDQNFAIVDYDFFDVDAGEDITFENVRELTFQTDQAAFLAGYVAAAMSETGVVGTYGGSTSRP